MLQVDIYFRQLGINRLAQSIADKIQKEDPRIYRLLQRYCDGVNYLANRSLFLPLEFQVIWAPFKPLEVPHVIAIYKLLEFHLTSGNHETVHRMQLEKEGLA